MKSRKEMQPMMRSLDLEMDQPALMATADATMILNRLQSSTKKLPVLAFNVANLKEDERSRLYDREFSS